MVMSRAVLPPEIARRGDKRGSALEKRKGTLVGMLVAEAAVTAGACQQRYVVLTVGDTGVHRYEAAVRENAQIFDISGDRGVVRLTVGHENIQQMELEYFRAGKGAFPAEHQLSCLRLLRVITLR